MDTNNKVIIDWLTVSFKVRGFQDFLFDYLHFPFNDLAVQPTRSRNFDNGFYFCGIRIMWNSSDGLVMLDCTGQGCRTVESLNPNFTWKNFFLTIYDYLVNRNEDGHYIAHVSRIDLAYDLFDDDKLTIDFINKYVTNRKWACLSGQSDVRYPKDDHGKTIIEKCIYFGSSQSDRILRIYDKALEQGITDHKWIRFEMQCRNKNATSVVLNLFKYNFDVGRVYKGILQNYIRFITKSRDTFRESHINEINTCRWWLKLLGNVGGIKQLYLPGIKYNAGTLHRYIKTQTSSSLKTFVALHQGDITDLLDIIENSQHNYKQKQLLKSNELDYTIQYTSSDLEFLKEYESELF